MSSRATKIINALYAEELRPRRKPGLFERLSRKSMRVKSISEKHRREIIDLYRERQSLLSKGRVGIGVCIAFLAFLTYLSVVYFNRLTQAEQDVFKEKAKIDSLLQRRRNISINLARTLRDYAVHEEGIFSHVSNMRSSTKGRRSDGTSGAQRISGEGSSPASQSGASQDPDLVGSAKKEGIVDRVLSMLEGSSKGRLPLDNELASLMAVAESYPDLKLSENFRKFMDALIETEKELSNRRMSFSETVNNYTTQLKTFPGVTFAAIYGFEMVPYFEADGEATEFRAVDY